MKEISLARLVATIGCAGMLMLASSVSYAERSSDPDAWKHSVSIYLWLPTIDGTLKYNFGLGNSAEVEADNTLDAFKAFMGTYEARKNKWSLLVDAIYLDLDDSSKSSVPLPGGGALATKGKLDLTGIQLGLYGGYNFYQTDRTSVDLIAGLRYLSIDTDVELQATGPIILSPKISRDSDLYDGIVGLRGKVNINEKWFVPFHGDIGAGDSDLTWQTMAGIGYQAGWGDTILSYRYLSWDQSDDELIQDLSFSGPQLGVKFHF